MTDLARLRELLERFNAEREDCSVTALQHDIELFRALRNAAPALLTAAEDNERLRVENQIRAQEYAILLGLWKEASEQLEKAERALFNLWLTAALLLQNSIGCAEKHHGADYTAQAMPGWLRDSRAAVEAARNHLAQYDSHAEQKETT